MPKQLWKIEDFDGGLNTQTDPRDIRPDEFVQLQNMMIDERGRIRTAGALANHIPEGANSSLTADVYAGHGLFTYKADYSSNGSAYTGADASATGYIAWADAENAEVDLWNTSSDAWVADKVDLGSNDTAASYYYADGVLRVANVLGSASNQPRWWGYIDRTRFTAPNSISAGNETIDKWLDTNTALTAPTSFTMVTSATSDAASYPADGVGLDVKIVGAVGGTWAADTYQVGITFIYDGNQESLIYAGSSAQTIAVATDSSKLTVTVHAANNTGGTTYNERVTGARVYIKSSESGAPWRVLCTCSFTGNAGVMAGVPQADMYTFSVGTTAAAFAAPWVAAVGNGKCYAAVTVLDPPLDTYETVNGFSGNMTTNSFDAAYECWGDAVVANRRAFVARPKMTSRDNGSIIKENPDRIMYSEVGRFDTFPVFNYIDIGTNDGDEFTAVASLADRLLCFKRNKLYVINISSGSDTSWYLETEHEGYGVDWPASIAKTENGVVFCNKTGVYFYASTGQVSSLSERIRNDYQSFYKSGDSWPYGLTQLGYAPKYKHIVIMQDASGSDAANNNAYIFDMETNSWTYMLDFFTSQKTYSNFTVDWNNELIVGYDTNGSVSQLQKYNSASAAVTNQIAKTKDIDFGEPGRLKKVYKVYATYKSNADQATPLEFAVDGKASFSDFATGSNVAPAGGDSGDLDANSMVWDVATFTADSVQTCQSIQLKFNPPDSGTFEVNDISIEYRPLYKRVS